jgi:hypothetical protein
MHQRKHVLSLAILVAAAFTQAAHAQTTLRYQFKDGDKLDYVTTQKMKMSMNLAGKDVETKMDISMDMTWTVLKTEPKGNAQVQFKVNGAKISMDGPTGKIEADSKDKNEADDPVGKIFSQMVKALGAMEMTATILPTGAMKDVKISEESAKALKNLPGADKLGDIASPENFKNMLGSLVFPEEAVVKGKTWVNKIDAKTQFGKTGTESTFTYEGTTDKDGVTLEKISVKAKISVEPDPKAEIKIKVKDDKGSGTLLFDNKIGRLIETSITQRTEMQLGVQGLSISQTVDQTTTIRLKTKKTD